jgi:hypothetical protein
LRAVTQHIAQCALTRLSLHSVWGSDAFAAKRFAAEKLYAAKLRKWRAGREAAAAAAQLAQCKDADV